MFVSDIQSTVLLATGLKKLILIIGLKKVVLFFVFYN